MGPKNLIVLLAFGLVAAVFGFLFFRYRKWGPKLWADRVMAHFASLVAERDRLFAESKLGPAFRLRQLKDELQRKQRRAVPPGALADFPGIGPATVDKLTLAGCQSLDDLIDYPFESIPGFGPARSADLRAAVRGLMHQTRAAFDDGRSPQGQEYLRAVGELAEAERDAQLARDHRLTALDDALDDTRPLKDVAERITFTLYLEHSFANKPVPGLAEGMLDRPLPAPEVGSPPSPPVARPAPSSPPVAKPVPNASPTANPQLAKLRAFVRFGFVAARADGRIAKDEKKAIRAFLGDTFGGDQTLVRFIDPEMETVEADVPDEAPTLAAVADLASEVEKKSLYAFAERIADASGERNDREAAFLDRVREAFRIPESAPAVAAAKTAPATSAAPVSPDYHAALDIPPGVELTVELIRRKYAMAYDKNDPAKAAALGDEYVKMAEAKRAAAKAAAEALLAPFNAPLDPPPPPPPPSDIRHNPDLDDVFGR